MRHARFWKFILLFPIVVMLFLMPACGDFTDRDNAPSAAAEADGDIIRIGLLFSTDGTSATVEKSMLNAAIMAIDEINANGGVNGKQIAYLHENYASDPAIAAEKIEKLIQSDQVAATIGCYTSSSREAVLPVLEENNSLLVYPAYTEGEESHSNVIYTGAMPNQQMTDFIPWLVENCGQKVFFVGSDYRYPLICNKIGKILVEQAGGEVVGEEYVATGGFDFTEVFRKIRETEPDFIYCNLIGDSLISFYKTYQKEGIDPADCPIASTTTDEVTIQSMGAQYAEGHYLSLNYFSTLDTAASKTFVQNYYTKFQDGTIPICSATATYNSCYLLAEALEKVKNPYDGARLAGAFSNLEFDSPQGKIKVDEENHCTWQIARFAQVQNGSPRLLYESPDWIWPDPWHETLY